MSVKRIITIVCVMVLAGFIISLIGALYHIARHSYFSYHLYWLITLTLTKYLTAGVLYAGFISAIVLLGLKMLTAGARIMWKKFFSDAVRIDISLIDKRRLLRLLLIVAGLLYLAAGIPLINRTLFESTPLVRKVLFHVSALLLLYLLRNAIGRRKTRHISFRKYLHRLAAVFAIGVVVLNSIICFANHLFPRKGKNIVLIVVDTLRADHLGCYGYGRNTSPNIGALAQDGFLFNNALSESPWTTPAIQTMFTAQYPAILGSEYEPVRMLDAFLTIAEIAKNNRYVTAGIISHVWVSARYGFGQGFDFYDEENAKDHYHISSPSVTDKAISFLTQHRNRPFFLFVHYFDPHAAFMLHEAYDYYPDYRGPVKSATPISDLRAQAKLMSGDDLEFVRALYDSEISFTDEHIGRLIDELKKMGLYDDTLIVLTADHGEEFCDREHKWIGHTITLYQELIHVPLIIKRPQQPKQQAVNRYVSSIDLMPTIVSYAGLVVPALYVHDGTVIAASDEAGVSPKRIFSETKVGVHFQSVTAEGWKCIHDRIEDRYELFDLDRDPLEKKNEAHTNTQRLNRMKTYLKEWNSVLHAKKPQRAPTKPQLSELDIDRLRSLGYLQ